MRLNDTVIRYPKPGPKQFKLFDGGGLYPSFTPTQEQTGRSPQSRRIRSALRNR
jgi:hypothetical protein